MPIGGGTFTVQNKILPGAYINFVSMGTNAKMGSRGVAALPLELNWGPDDKVFTMTATDFNATSLKVFGYDPTDANILLVREALKRAKSLLIYRVNGGGTKASATVGGMTVTAKYGGTHGNDIMRSPPSRFMNKKQRHKKRQNKTITPRIQQILQTSKKERNKKQRNFTHKTDTEASETEGHKKTHF